MELEPELEAFVRLRPILPNELNFVMSSWLKSLRAHNHFFGCVARNIYYSAHAASIELNLKESKVLVATPKSNDNIVVAYLVYEDRSPNYIVVHYAYVKQTFRRMGLAKYLIESISDGRPLVITHITNKVSLTKDIKFNPYFFKLERL